MKWTDRVAKAERRHSDFILHFKMRERKEGKRIIDIVPYSTVRTLAACLEGRAAGQMWESGVSLYGIAKNLSSRFIHPPLPLSVTIHYFKVEL